jgi:hypothetical protein
LPSTALNDAYYEKAYIENGARVPPPKVAISERTFDAEIEGGLSRPAQ